VSETDVQTDEHAKGSFEEGSFMIAALSAADIAAPELVAHVLQGSKLVPAELGQLDSAERDELVGAMQAVDVTLGDRFRLRRMSAAAVLPGVGSSECLEMRTAADFNKAARALQSTGDGGGGGVSGDSIALMVTALLGVGSFIVQAVTEKRAARAAEALQRELDRELAGRESEPNIAAVQLDRVRLQMAECARPLQYAASIVGHSIAYLGLELSLAWDVPVLGVSGSESTVSPPAEPHTVLVTMTKQFSWVMKNGGVPINTALRQDEIARLQAEPEWRNRWTETWVSLEPLLKEIEDTIWTKAHLAEPVKLNSVTSTFPFRALGCSWEEAFVTPGVLYHYVAVWTRQWCAPLHCPMLPCAMPHAPASHAHSGAGRREPVRGRWARGEYDQLQPTAPGLVAPLVQLAAAQGRSCGVRETQLQVRDRLTVHFALHSVQCVQPQPGVVRGGAPRNCNPCVALKT
jgi:hypothetical protein